MTTATQTHTLEYVFDGLPTLRLHDHRGDIRVVHDGDVGTVRLTLRTRRPVDFGEVDEHSEGFTATVSIPALSGPSGAPGLAVRGRTFSFGLGSRGVAVDVEAHVPAGAELFLDTGSGDISVDGRSGPITAKTGAGDIRVETSERVNLDTGAGDLRPVSIAGGSLRTGTGDIILDRSTGDTSIRTGAGDVTVLNSRGTLRVNTGAGDVSARIDEGVAEIRTGMGDVAVQVPTGLPVWQDLTSGVGDVTSRIERRGEPEPGEPFLRVIAHSGAGDVTLGH
jgi:hypothetical protein